MHSCIRWSCQCPLGLVPHFYKESICFTYLVMTRVSMPSRASTSFLQMTQVYNVVRRLECQCPLGLVPHFYDYSFRSVFNGIKDVSMPSRASTSFLQYPFKNLGFMRFPEPVFAGICQNILTVTVFRAC